MVRKYFLALIIFTITMPNNMQANDDPSSESLATEALHHLYWGAINGGLTYGCFKALASMELSFLNNLTAPEAWICDRERSAAYNTCVAVVALGCLFLNFEARATRHGFNSIEPSARLTYRGLRAIALKLANTME